MQAESKGSKRKWQSQHSSKRKGSVKHQRKRVKQARSKGQTELFEGDDGKEIIAAGGMNRSRKNKEKNPLMQPLLEEEEPSKEQIMQQWFSQDVFADAVKDGMLLLEKSECEEGKEKEEEAKKVKKSSKKNRDMDDSSSSSDEDEDDMDVDTKAEILAYAKKTLRKKQRQEIEDDAYNKYMFDDDEESLPRWFVEDEKRHNKRTKPVTREEVEAMKARLGETNARPAKKVQKYNAIADQTDISEISKKKMIGRLYKPKRPNKKELVVAKKGVQVRTGKGKKLVDRRMKKDRRTKGSGKKGKAVKWKGKLRLWP